MMNLRLTIARVRDIRARTGIDLLADAGSPATTAAIAADYVWLSQAVAIAGGPDNLSGDALEDASSAFMDALVEFFPKPSVTSGDVPDESNVNPWHVVYKAAGAVGVVPDDMSVRELFWMAEGAWEPYAQQIADFRNANKGKTGHAVAAADCNPYARSGRTLRSRREAKACRS